MHKGAAMKKFRATYEYGPHYSFDIIVKAKTKAEARKKADVKAAKEAEHPIFVHMFELQPVDREIFEHEISKRDKEIERLKTLLVDIYNPIKNEIGSSWSVEDAERDGGGFTTRERLEAAERAAGLRW
jgi:hypothetical protein